MAQPLTVALPPNLHLAGNYTISVGALDPSTGGINTDVAVSNVTLHVQLESGEESQLEVGPFMLVPGPSG
jgi:hypothetical protein